MSIKGKLWLNSIFIILIGVVFFVIQYIYHDVTKNTFKKSRILDQITQSSFQFSLLSREIALHPTEKRPVFQWKIEHTKLGKLLYSVQKIQLNDSQEWQSLVYSHKKLFDLHEKLLKNITISENDIRKDAFIRQRERINNRIFMEAQSIVSNASKLREINNIAYQEEIVKLRNMGTIFIMSMVVLIFVFALYIAKGIIKGLKILKNGTQKVTDGDMKISVKLNTKDELGDFANDFNIMVAKLSSTMTSKSELENIVKEKTVSLHKSRLAAISVMEDVNHQRIMIDSINNELKNEIEIRKKTEYELVKAKKDADYANKSKSIFLANMSHELRTPLNAIMGFSELLRKDKKVLQAQKNTLDIINKSGNNLLKLINSVLDLAKIETGRIPLEDKPFDLGDIVKESMDLMGERAQSKGLKIELDQSSDFPRFISSDPSKIRQIIINFLSNSVKYTNEGGIKVMLNADANVLHMEVSDTGVGISPDDLKKVFEPFVQVGEASGKTGTGLGLAITKQFVELLNGEVGVESEVGKGSSFWAKIPYKDAKEDEVVKLVKKDSIEVIGLDESQKSIKVLMVEDHLDNRILLRSILNILGIEIKEAVNGQEAVDIFQSWKPDFIWMDRRMPIMNGEKATKLIRGLPGGDKVVIVALTASAFHEEREKIMESGMDDFVAKPYRQDEIYQCMQKYLNLNYIYKEEYQEDSKQTSTYTKEELLEKIKELDSTLIDELYNAALLLDLENMQVILGKIENVDQELAGILRTMVNNYEYKSILGVVGVIKKGDGL